MSEPNSYKIGFGKPPKANQFPKGRSANPGGRPRGSKNLATLISEAAYEKIKVTQKNGAKRKLRRIEAAFLQLATKAAQGDHKAVTSLIELLAEVEQKAAAARPTEMHLGDKELAVLHLVYERMKVCAPFPSSF